METVADGAAAGGGADGDGGARRGGGGVDGCGSDDVATGETDQVLAGFAVVAGVGAAELGGDRGVAFGGFH